MLFFLTAPILVFTFLGAALGETDSNALHQYEVLYKELLRVTKFNGKRLEKLEKKLKTADLNTDIRRKRARDEYISLNESVKNIYEGWNQAIVNLDDGDHPIDEDVKERIQQDRLNYMDIQKKYYQQYFKAGKNLTKFMKKFEKLTHHQ